MRSDDAFLRDIIEAAGALGDHTAGLDLDTFAHVRVVRSASLHELSIIGEAAAKLPTELRDRYPDIPWREIIGFRHVIVHGYFTLNWERVWNTIVRDIPRLEQRAREILASEFPEEAS